MIFILYLCKPIRPLVAQMGKSLLAIQETGIWSLGWEDPLVKEMAIHSSNLAWEIPWMVEPGRCGPRGRKESDTTEQPHFHIFSKLYAQGSKLFISLQAYLTQGSNSHPMCFFCIAGGFFPGNPIASPQLQPKKGTCPSWGFPSLLSWQETNLKHICRGLPWVGYKENWLPWVYFHGWD